MNNIGKIPYIPVYIEQNEVERKQELFFKEWDKCSLEELEEIELMTLDSLELDRELAEKDNTFYPIYKKNRHEWCKLVNLINSKRKGD